MTWTIVFYCPHRLHVCRTFDGGASATAHAQGFLAWALLEGVLTPDDLDHMSWQEIAPVPTRQGGG
jgi:hypothetical protein